MRAEQERIESEGVLSLSQLIRIYFARDGLAGPLSIDFGDEEEGEEGPFPFDVGTEDEDEEEEEKGEEGPFPFDVGADE